MCMYAYILSSCYWRRLGAVDSCIRGCVLMFTVPAGEVLSGLLASEPRPDSGDLVVGRLVLIMVASKPHRVQAMGCQAM